MGGKMSFQTVLPVKNQPAVDGDALASRRSQEFSACP